MDEEAIFLEALQQPTPEERLAFLTHACAGNTEMRRDIERLLEAHEKAGSFLQANQAGVGPDAPLVERPGTAIGPYNLLEQIGEGGFGIVFMAEQQHPVRRKVALKVLKPGMDSRQVIARFEAERQALALMDHPNIARVFDGGETAGGRPYFVMELVKGIPITDYCDEMHWTPRERLELFLEVCQAVQHAHQKGIIHRDLKPSNVLVTLHDGTPVVKVIDFGIAKAVGQQLTEKTLFTNFAQLIGTPLYMSPEQAALSGLDVDTRSDIYSLGVLLYELLTGTTPFARERFQDANYDEIRRIIREEEPPKPSTRISTLGQAATTLSTQRQSDPRRLSQLFRGELDWIVMTCLEKDRNRRYQTANSLAQDLERYLHDEPVLACPPSALYRFRKFARRHRAVLVSVSLIALALVAGTAVSLWQAWRATRAESLAEERFQAEQAARVAESKRRLQARSALDANTSLLLGDLLARQQTLTEEHKKFLRQALQAYEEFAADTAEDEASRYGAARALANVGLIRRRLAPSTEAQAAWQEAVKRYARLTADFPDTVQYRSDLAKAQGELGAMLAMLGKREQASAALTEALAVGERLIAEFPAVPEYQQQQAECYLELANLLPARGQAREAEAATQKALALLEPIVARFPPSRDARRILARGLSQLSKQQADRGDAAMAVDSGRKAVGLLKQQVAESADQEDRLILAQACNALANRLKSAGRPEEVAQAYREALALFRQLADDFPTVAKYRLDLAICLMNWGTVLQAGKRPADAEPPFRDALRVTKSLAEDYPAMVEYRTILATVQSNLGNLLVLTNRLQEAEACYNDAIAIRKVLVAAPQASSASHSSLAATLGHLAALRSIQKQYRSACELFEEALRHDETALKFDPPNVVYRTRCADNRQDLAACRLQLADHAAAADAMEQFVHLGLDPRNHSYVAACFLSRCALLAQNDSNLGPNQRQQKSEFYAKRALELLRTALKNGYKDVESLRTNEDVAALRTRPDFQALLAELEPKPKPDK
jgi:serine/threonine protein kinase